MDICLFLLVFLRGKCEVCRKRWMRNSDRFRTGTRQENGRTVPHFYILPSIRQPSPFLTRPFGPPSPRGRAWAGLCSIAVHPDLLRLPCRFAPCVNADEMAMHQSLPCVKEGGPKDRMRWKSFKFARSFLKYGTFPCTTLDAYHLISAYSRGRLRRSDTLRKHFCRGKPMVHVHLC